MKTGKSGRIILINDFESKTGNIEGFHNIRFMRMLLTGFEEPTFLRFATLGLVRSEWRSYQRSEKPAAVRLGRGNHH